MLVANLKILHQDDLAWKSRRASDVVIFGSCFWILQFGQPARRCGNACLGMEPDFQTGWDFLLDLLTFSYTDLISSCGVPSNETT